MAFVVVDAELVGDQASHLRAAPQRRREVVGLGAGEQQLLQMLELLASQSRLAAGTTGLRQPPLAVCAVLLHPAADALLCGVEPTSDLPLR